MKEKLEPKAGVLWVRGGKEWNALPHTTTPPFKADGPFHIALTHLHSPKIQMHEAVISHCSQIHPNIR